jgi:hypothetical protein
VGVTFDAGLRDVQPQGHGEAKVPRQGPAPRRGHHIVVPAPAGVPGCKLQVRGIGLRARRV